jgi:hypothetical protein
MRIGLVGLGKMGSAMVSRLVQRDHQVVAFDLDEDAVKEAEGNGGEGAGSLACSRPAPCGSSFPTESLPARRCRNSWATWLRAI